MPIAVADKSIHEGVELLGAFVKVRRTEHDAQDDHRIGGMNAKGYSSCLRTFAAVGFIAITSSAFAWGLTDEDYDYLRKTQNLERYNHPSLTLARRNGLGYTI